VRRRIRCCSGNLAWSFVIERSAVELEASVIASALGQIHANPFIEAD